MHTYRDRQTDNETVGTVSALMTKTTTVGTTDLSYRQSQTDTVCV